nr:hypothetical protein [Phycisphaerae bacterium]
MTQNSKKRNPTNAERRRLHTGLRTPGRAVVPGGLCVLLWIGASCGTAFAQGAEAPRPDRPRQMEHLGRGVAAVHQGEGRVFVSWRCLGTDPDGIAFNVYRKASDAEPVKRNDAPLVQATCFQDSGLDLAVANEYFIRPVVDGKEGEQSRPFLSRIRAQAPAQEYFEVPIRLPERTQAAEGSVGDLDGDGEYEIVLKGWQRPTDTASSGITGNTVLQGYRLDGTPLW